MSSLTPEPRVDVNGRVVIRHVRSDFPASHPRRGHVPSPTGVRSDSHRAISDMVYNTIRDYLPMRSYSPIYTHPDVVKLSRKDISSYFDQMSREIVDECINQMFTLETDTGYPSLLVSAVNNHEDANMLSDITFLYNTEDVTVDDMEWHDKHPIAINHAYLRAMVRGIRSYSDWGLVIPERLRLASGEQQEIISALYQVTETIDIEIDQRHLNIKLDNDGVRSSISLRDEAIFNVIVAHPESTEEISSVLRSRGCDGQVLADYFRGNRPLRNGIL